MYKILSTQPSKQSMLVFRAHLRPAHLLHGLLEPHDLLAFYEAIMGSIRWSKNTNISLHLTQLGRSLQTSIKHIAAQKYPPFCAQEYLVESLIMNGHRSRQDLKCHSVLQSHNLLRLAQFNGQEVRIKALLGKQVSLQNRCHSIMALPGPIPTQLSRPAPTNNGPQAAPCCLLL